MSRQFVILKNPVPEIYLWAAAGRNMHYAPDPVMSKVIHCAASAYIDDIRIHPYGIGEGFGDLFIATEYFPDSNSNGIVLKRYPEYDNHWWYKDNSPKTHRVPHVHFVTGGAFAVTWTAQQCAEAVEDGIIPRALKPYAGSLDWIYVPDIAAEYLSGFQALIEHIRSDEALLVIRLGGTQLSAVNYIRDMSDVHISHGIDEHYFIFNPRN